MATIATIMKTGIDVYVAQIIEDNEVINLETQRSREAAIDDLSRRVSDTVIVSNITWQKAQEQAATNLVNSLVPVEAIDTFGKDALLFEKREDGTTRKMLVTRATKNLFYIVPVDCQDATPRKVSKGTLYKKAAAQQSQEN